MKIKLNKFLFLAAIFTVFCLIYVYQQSEVFRLAYAGQKRQVACQNLANKNSLLRYSIDKKTSLVHLGNKISESSDFQMPDSYQYVRLSTPGQQPQVQPDILARFFGIGREAEARTIKP